MKINRDFLIKAFGGTLNNARKATPYNTPQRATVTHTPFREDGELNANGNVHRYKSVQMYLAAYFVYKGKIVDDEYSRAMLAELTKLARNVNGE